MQKMIAVILLLNPEIDDTISIIWHIGYTCDYPHEETEGTLSPEFLMGVYTNTECQQKEKCGKWLLMRQTSIPFIIE